MGALSRLWRGEVPLAQAFWHWAVLGGIIVNLSTTIAFLVLIMHGQIAAAFVAGYAFSVPYNIIVAVGVWRSAAHYEGDRRLADLARIVTVIGMAVLSVT
ncbi:MAG: hypothetical protein AB7O50_09110 [Pseudolabrys sp.]